MLLIMAVADVVVLVFLLVVGGGGVAATADVTGDVVDAVTVAIVGVYRFC